MVIQLKFLNNQCDCGSGRFSRMLSTRDFGFRSTDVETDILRCVACGTVFPAQFPTTDSLGAAYADYYTAVEPNRNTVFRRAIRALTKRYVSRHLPPGARSVLDYGCGSGSYLESLDLELRYGTDITPASGSFVWVDLKDLDRLPIQFDWITLAHVLEHLTEPDDAMKVVVEHLAPGGGVWIATPNADSFLFDAFGTYARDIDFPRHRQIYSRRRLTTYLSEFGLEVTFHAPPRLNAFLNYLFTVRVTLADRSRPALRRWGHIVRGSAAVIAHLLWPSADRSPELIVIARRADDALPGKRQPPIAGHTGMQLRQPRPAI